MQDEYEPHCNKYIVTFAIYLAFIIHSTDMEEINQII
jgi:hypothetical protein